MPVQTQPDAEHVRVVHYLDETTRCWCALCDVESRELPKDPFMAAACVRFFAEEHAHRSTFSLGIAASEWLAQYAPKVSP